MAPKIPFMRIPSTLDFTYAVVALLFIVAPIFSMIGINYDYKELGLSDLSWIATLLPLFSFLLRPFTLLFGFGCSFIDLMYDYYGIATGIDYPLEIAWMVDFAWILVLLGTIAHLYSVTRTPYLTSHKSVCQKH